MTFNPCITDVMAADDSKPSRARLREPVVALRLIATGRELPLDANVRRWVLGKAPTCDLVIDDPFVSGLHCTFERRAPDGPVIARDRSSRNGTFVNGVPIEAAALRPGSLVVVGRTAMVAVAASQRGKKSPFELLRGRDPAFVRAVADARRAAQTDCSILIVGETGTGKDLLARLIHETSPRATGRYVAVNCGAIPRELIGSELFGHEKGAFTGAVTDRDGYFVEACGGTLFLDELGELPVELQPHLLRVLENRLVRRVGGVVERPIDVRIVAATNQLEGLGTPESRLRLDLFHRVATVVVVLPPLRERRGDIRELVLGMMADLAPQFGDKQVTGAAWQMLDGYDWPGNVRELSHAVARAMALGGDLLGPRDFLPDLPILRAPKRTLRAPTSHAQHAAEAPAVAVAAGGAPALPPYEALLRSAMADALSRNPSIRTAARSLGMPKSTFADKAKAWGLLDARPKR